MAEYEEPSFLAETFLWQRRGYQLTQPLPADVRARTNLSSHNPWLRLVAALESAKRGAFGGMPVLLEALGAELPPFLRLAAAELLGDAGPRAVLDTLKPRLEKSSDEVRMAACRAAYCSGYLHLVPFLVETWLSLESSDDQATLSFMLSDLLEAKAGPVIANEAYTPEAYERLLLGLVKKLSVDLGTDRAPVWEGELFGVVKLARRMLQLIEDPGALLGNLEVDFLTLRHKFEAATGVDCTLFYQGDDFRPLAASAILEEFLESDSAAKYEEGVRYFFGHRIPD